MTKSIKEGKISYINFDEKYSYRKSLEFYLDKRSTNFVILVFI